MHRRWRTLSLTIGYFIYPRRVRLGANSATNAMRSRSQCLIAISRFCQRPPFPIHTVSYIPAKASDHKRSASLLQRTPARPWLITSSRFAQRLRFRTFSRDPREATWYLFIVWTSEAVQTTDAYFHFDAPQDPHRPKLHVSKISGIKIQT